MTADKNSLAGWFEDFAERLEAIEIELFGKAKERPWNVPRSTDNKTKKEDEE